MRIGDCGEAPPLFLESVLAWFFLQKSGLDAREREKHDSGGNVEQIMNWTWWKSRWRYSFPKTRFEITLTELASTTEIFWLVQSVKRRTRWKEIRECLRAAGMILMCWPQLKKKKFKPWRHWPLLTGLFEKPERSNTRYGWHGVSFLDNSHIATATTGDQNESVSFAEDHVGPHNVQRSKEGQPERREMRQHMWHTVKSLCPFTPKWACSHKKRWRQDQRWLIVVLLDAWALGKNWTGWHAWTNSCTDHLALPWIVRGRPGTPLQMERDHRANVWSHFR